GRGLSFRLGGPALLGRRRHPRRRSALRLRRLHSARRPPLRHGLGFACTWTGPRLAAAFRPHRPGSALNRRWRRPEIACGIRDGTRLRHIYLSNNRPIRRGRRTASTEELPLHLTALTGGFPQGLADGLLP